MKKVKPKRLPATEKAMIHMTHIIQELAATAATNTYDMKRVSDRAIAEIEAKERELYRLCTIQVYSLLLCVILARVIHGIQHSIYIDTHSSTHSYTAYIA